MIVALQGSILRISGNFDWWDHIVTKQLPCNVLGLFWRPQNVRI